MLAVMFTPRALVTAATLIGALALPASASATLVASQTASPKPVKKGQLVTITVNVSNPGPGVDFADPTQVELFGIRGGTEGTAVNDPYQSATPSQGSCSIHPTGRYQVADCNLGDMAQGASARIVAVVRVNESMTHQAAPKFGATSELNVAASTPPTVTGSRLIKLRGLPGGCVPGDFTLRIATSAPRVKRIVATMDQGFDNEGEDIVWQRSAKGSRLKVKVPAGHIFDPSIGKTYKLTIAAQRAHAGPLRRTVLFGLCG
jgi:hypothetical protein